MLFRACSKPGALQSKEVDFFDITAWRELGQTIANYKKKGDPILVEGRLQYRTWEAQDGSKMRDRHGLRYC